jgi:tetratricopeptide (TPR) repeat protein
VPLDTSLKANLFYRWGLVLEGQGLYGEARQCFAESALAPVNFPAAQLQARWCLARLLFLAEEYAAARPHLEAIQDSEELNSSQRCEARYDIAMVLQNTGRLPEAVNTLEHLRAIASSRHDSVWELKAELALASLYEQSGNVSAARAALERVASHPEAELLVKRAAFVALGRFRGR